MTDTASKPVVLINMSSQHGGRPSGVAMITFSVLAELLKSDAFHYVLRSPWAREQLPENLRTDRLKVITIPRPKILVLDVFYQMLVMPFVAARHKAAIVLNMDPYGSPTGGRARLTVVHDLYFRVITKQIGLRAILTTGLIFTLVTRFSKRMITVSDATLRDLEQFYPYARGKAVRIYNDANLDAGGDPGRELEAPQSYVLAVGNATSNKNFGLLAEAFKLLIERGETTLKLVHVGDDREETMAAVLGPERAATYVRRYKNLSVPDLAALYRNALCLCVPSLYEGFCVPIVEAQAQDCPVLCADASVMPEVSGEAALLFRLGDPQGLADLIQRLKTEPDLRAEMIAKGRINRQRFSWPKAAQAYEAEIRRLIGNS